MLVTQEPIIFKVHKSNRTSLEEYSSEEWARKPKRHCGYLESKSTTFPLVCKKLVGENKSINDSKEVKGNNKRPPIIRKRQKLSELRSDSSYSAKNLAPEPASNVITDEDIVEQDVLCPDLPGFVRMHISSFVFVMVYLLN